MKPNVLILMCDQYRGDCLSYNHHPDVRTPYLDSLCADGIVFENAHSATPSCIPARASLLTGKSQTKTGRVGYEDMIDWNYDHYLATYFNQEGYHTKCIGKMHVHPPTNRCDFQDVLLHDGALACYRRTDIPYYMHQKVHDDYLHSKQNIDVNFDYLNNGSECNSWVVSPWMYDEKDHPTNWVVDESIRYLETRDRNKPFLLMSSFVRPHPPLDAPKSFLDMYINQDLAKPIYSDWDDLKACEDNQFYYDSIHGTINEKNIHDARAGYYASISHVDQQIGRLITYLKNDNLFDDTIILFISDHGEMLFDHHLWRKGLPYEASTHIPCILRVGKNIKNYPHFNSNAIVELRDILPTLLDLCDIQIPSDIDGISLKPIINKVKDNVRDYLHGEHSLYADLSNHYILSNKYKYIWFSNSGREQFFNLDDDPNETINLIDNPNYQTIIEEHRKILIKELSDREEGYSDGKKLIKGCKVQNIIKV